MLTVTDKNGRVLLRDGASQPRWGTTRAAMIWCAPSSSAKNRWRRRASCRRRICGGRRRELAEQARFTFIDTPKARVAAGHGGDRRHDVEGGGADPRCRRTSVLGIVYGGVLLNRNFEIVDRIKQTVFQNLEYKGKDIGTATIFQDDLRISTNVKNEDGSRAIGTRVAEDVYEQVVRKGKPWIGRAFVVNHWYIAAYEPIRDLSGSDHRHALRRRAGAEVCRFAAAHRAGFPGDHGAGVAGGPGPGLLHLQPDLGLDQEAGHGLGAGRPRQPGRPGRDSLARRTAGTGRRLQLHGRRRSRSGTRNCGSSPPAGSWSRNGWPTSASWRRAWLTRSTTRCRASSPTRTCSWNGPPPANGDAGVAGEDRQAGQSLPRHHSRVAGFLPAAETRETSVQREPDLGGVRFAGGQPGPVSQHPHCAAPRPRPAPGSRWTHRRSSRSS